ncbi:MAG: hypothetical protein K9L56_14255 [Clostridiales bacterium]|nr:hypothetical protein [Clostridiales bacterium]
MPFETYEVIDQARRMVNEPDFGWASKAEFLSWTNDALQKICHEIEPLVTTKELGVSGDKVVVLPEDVVEVKEVIHDEKEMEFDENPERYGYNIERTNNGLLSLVFANEIDEPVSVKYSRYHYEVSNLDDEITLPKNYKKAIVLYLVAQFNFKDAEPQVYQQQVQLWKRELMELKRTQTKQTKPSTSRVTNQFWN